MTKQQRGDPIHGPERSKPSPFSHLSCPLFRQVVLLSDGEVCYWRRLLWFTVGLVNIAFCFRQKKKNLDWPQENALDCLNIIDFNSKLNFQIIIIIKDLYANVTSCK